MACRWCAHWRNTRKKDDFSIAQEGNCHRYPETITTQWDHFCGEFISGPGYHNSSALLDMWATIEDYRDRDDQKRIRARILREEKKKNA